MVGEINEGRAFVQAFHEVEVRFDTGWFSGFGVEEKAIARAVSFARKLKISNAPFPWIKSLTFSVANDRIVLTLGGRVQNRKTHFDYAEASDAIPVRHEATLSMDALATDEEPDRLLADVVRIAIHEAVLHEVDEAIYVFGRRPFDPHRGEKLR